MKKSLLVAILTVVMVGAVAVTGAVNAQAPTPNEGVTGFGYGYQAQLSEDGLGIYHDELMATFSELLGIDVAELEAKIADGESLVQLALDAGYTFDEIKALMPVGAFGNVGNMGRGGRWANPGFTAPAINGQYYDGTCLNEDGTVTPQYLQRNFGDRGAGRWN